MNSRFQRRSEIGWSVSLLAVVLLALLGTQFRPFQAIDGEFYDSFHRLSPKQVSDSAILLVECSPATLESGNPKFDTLLERISQASPLAIGVVNERARESIVNSPRTENGCPIAEGRPAKYVSGLESVPTGFLDLSVRPQTIFRLARVFTRNRGSQISSFERTLISQTGVEPKETLPTVGIRFGSSVNSIPRLSDSRILSQNYLPEQIANRIVIVGEALPESAGYWTPVSKLQKMTHLEVRGFTILTLLRNNSLQQAGLVKLFLCLLVFAACLFFMTRKMKHTHLVYAIPGFFIAAVTFSFLAFRLFSLYVPSTAIMFLAFAVPACIVLERFKVLKSIISRRQIKVSTHSISETSGETGLPWSQIATAANQLFGTKRQAIFCLKPESGLLSIVNAPLSVDEDQILERRRDMNREPWLAAMESGKATKLVDYNVLKNKEKDTANHTAEDFASSNGDTEFIVPLLSGSRIFGCMVLEFDQRDLRNWPDLANVINEFAAECTQLIRRHEASIRFSENEKRWYQTPELEDSRLIDIKEEQIEKAVCQIDRVFESDSCARILFDAFGNVIRANSRMIRRLRTERQVTDFVFTELLELTADIETHETHRVFRNAAVSGQKTELETRKGDLKGNVIVCPIHWNQSEDWELDSSGLLLEIYDSHEHAELDSLEQLLVNVPAIILPSEVESESESESESQGQSLLEEIEGLLNVARTVVASRKESTLESVWRTVLFNLQPKLQKSNLSIASHIEDSDSVLVRDYEVVTQNTEVCLNILAECSYHSGTLNVQLLNTASHWVLQLRNGQQVNETNWSSPRIIEKRQAERLFAARQSMQTCGGSVDVEDTANGEVVIHVSFPIVSVETMPGPGSSEACDA